MSERHDISGDNTRLSTDVKEIGLHRMYHLGLHLAQIHAKLKTRHPLTFDLFLSHWVYWSLQLCSWTFTRQSG
ncbi:hypothetical protein RRG08_022660 [Elysia crispata]|uniref:Uncharacterized protein n=1 Tax=Elysia crispata TaxID=231223 RepID=A0AAE0Z335_9GAST|nr:hypothetical protein RRG08_022660 [Elysia crispata]